MTSQAFGEQVKGLLTFMAGVAVGAFVRMLVAMDNEPKAMWPQKEECFQICGAAGVKEMSARGRGYGSDVCTCHSRPTP